MYINSKPSGDGAHHARIAKIFQPHHTRLIAVLPENQRLVNDALKDAYGADAVRYSLLSAAATTTLGALLFIWAARTIRADIVRAS